MNTDKNFKVTSVYKKAIIYFKADIAYSDFDDLQKKSDEFETAICLDLDNLHSRNFDYDFSYDGIFDVSVDDIPDWFFE